MGLRGMIPQKQASWVPFAKRGAEMVLKGDGTVVDGMGLLCARVAADAFKQIASVHEPVLSARSLAARAKFYGVPVDGLSATGKKPLNFTGYMIATLSYNVWINGNKAFESTVQ
jgi:hypothetical protein